jgi:hypothetical protein
LRTGAPVDIIPFVKPWCDWYHIMCNTFGTWLPGDPKGFRTRHHREHTRTRLRRVRTTSAGRIRSKCLPITDRHHFDNVVAYIRNHDAGGASLWQSQHDDRAVFHPAELLLD